MFWISSYNILRILFEDTNFVARRWICWRKVVELLFLQSGISHCLRPPMQWMPYVHHQALIHRVYITLEKCALFTKNPVLCGLNWPPSQDWKEWSCSWKRLTAPFSFHMGSKKGSYDKNPPHCGIFCNMILLLFSCDLLGIPDKV